MKRVTKEELYRIETAQSYEELTPYRDVQHWESMAADDRELLALLFIRQGERELANSTREVIETFELAARVAPQSSTVFLRIGEAYARRSSDLNSLALAHEKFSQAIHLDANNAAGWEADAAVLLRLGEAYQELAYLKEAERSVNAALALHASKKNTPPASLFVLIGDVWNTIGSLSGEAYDYWTALEYYRQALDIESDGNVVLWTSYGQALEALASLVGRPDFLQEAVDCYGRALAINSRHSSAQLHLANLYLRLFLEFSDGPALERAQNAYRTAMELDPQQANGWLGWAILLTKQAERQRDVDALKDALGKFQKANDCDPDNSMILSSWGEALTMLGSLTENLHLLRDGITKVVRALELEPDNSAVWRTYALCLTELGYYFGDESYYLEALDKVKIGLRQDENNPSLWAVLGRIYASLGTIRGDVSLLEEALKQFSKASDLYKVDMPPLYNEWGVCLMRLTEATHERRYIEAAVAKLEKAVRPFEEGHGVGDPEWLYNYGCALDFLGDHTDNPMHYEKAIQVLSHVVNQDPTYRHARYNLALAWSHLGELTAEVDFFQRAVEYFEELVDEDNEDDVSWNDLGLTLLNLAQLVRDPVHPERWLQLMGQAESRLLQATSLGNTSSYYNMACLYSLAGRFDAAMQFLERADTVDALPSVDDLRHDEWLEGLRQTEAFRYFINQLSYKPGRQAQ